MSQMDLFMNHMSATSEEHSLHAQEIPHFPMCRKKNSEWHKPTSRAESD
jgi:hypothetical protein